MTDLEEAIERDPDDAASYLVLADALLAAGDLRGELITVQHARGIRPDDKRLAKREKTLLNDHGAALLGAEAVIDVLRTPTLTRGPASTGPATSAARGGGASSR